MVFINFLLFSKTATLFFDSQDSNPSLMFLSLFILLFWQRVKAFCKLIKKLYIYIYIFFFYNLNSRSDESQWICWCSWGQGIFGYILGASWLVRAICDLCIMYLGAAATYCLVNGIDSAGLLFLLRLHCM